MDSSESPVYGEQEGAAYNGHFETVCYHPLFLFNEFGDCEGAMLRPGNVSTALSAGGRSWSRLWSDTRREGYGCCSGEMLPLSSRRCTNTWSPGTSAMPSGCLPTRYFRSISRALSALKRPEGELPEKPVIRYHEFQYRAKSWDHHRRVIAKVEWHRGELFPRVGFIVTNLSAKPKGVVHFYNRRGTAEPACGGPPV